MSVETEQVLRHGVSRTNQFDDRMRTNAAAVEDARGGHRKMRDSMRGVRDGAASQRAALQERSAGDTSDLARETSQNLEREVDEAIDESDRIERAVVDAAETLDVGRIKNDRLREEIITDIAETMTAVQALRQQQGGRGRAEARELMTKLLQRIEEKNGEAASNADNTLRELMTIAGTLRGGDTSTSASAAASTPPEAFNSARSGAGGGAGGSPEPAGGGGGAAAVADKPRLPVATPPQPGSGVKINLPGGSTVEAPNETAAKAVRQAITQLGVPYVWGGTEPGVGLDCSGLTMTAYGEAGLDIPRLAQEQTIGAEVPSVDELVPGDLVVWSGHVAMVIGDGKMIEAGDPVQISDIRTTNAGQQFIGMYRPTG